MKVRASGLLVVAWLSLAACKSSAGAAADAGAPHEARETKFENGQTKEKYSVKRSPKGDFVKDGLFTAFHQSTGQKAEEGNFVDDKSEGRWQRWDENGKLTVDVQYKAGLRQGEFTSYVNGEVAQHGAYQADKLQGKLSLVGPEGVMISGMMNAERPTGLWTVIDEKKRKRAEGKYEDGKLIGEVASFTVDGAAVPPSKTESCLTFEGYDLGRTTWPGAILSRLPDNHFPLAAGINKYSNGKMLRFNGSQLQDGWAQELLLIFDEHEVLTGMLATGKKGGSGSGLEAYRGQFDRYRKTFAQQYQLVSQTVPYVGDSKASFRSGACAITIEAPHQSFDMTISWRTPEFDRQFRAAP
jgi:antitoxin component YwqK of YwqJK toxin-antitoxin module